MVIKSNKLTNTINGYKINSVERLCNFILLKRTNLYKVNQLLWLLGIRAIIIDEAELEQYCKLIEEYCNKWQNVVERLIL
jgi:hypothetical protein